MAGSRFSHDLHQRIDELQKSEALFREIVEKQAEPVCRFSTEGSITYANPAFCTLTCIRIEDLIGRNVLNPAPGVEILKSLPLLNSETPSILIEQRAALPGTPGRLIQWHCVASFSPGGAVTGLQIAGRDLENQRQAEEALRRSEARYRRLADNIPLMVYRYDEDDKGALSFINRAAESITGYGLGDFYADPELGTKIIEPDDMKKIHAVGESDAEGWETPLELRIRRKDGGTAWIELRALPILGEQGELKGVEGIARDITQSKRIDGYAAAAAARSSEELRLSEQRYRLIAESSHDMIYIIDPDDRIRYVNNSAARLFEFNPEDMIGKSWREFTSDKAYDYYKSMYDAVFSTGEPVRFETDAALTGNHTWEDTRFVPLRYREGDNVQAVLGVTRDITERKTLEDAFRIAAENLQMGIYLRQEGAMVYANPFMTRYLGYTAEELKKISMMEIVHPDYRQKMRECSKQMLRGEISRPYEYRVITKTGEVKWLLESVVPFFHEGRAAVLGSVNDITRQKDVERLLIRVVRGRGETILLIHEDLIRGELVKEILEAFGYNVLLAVSASEAMSAYRQARMGIELVVIDKLKSGVKDLVEQVLCINPDARVVLSSDVVNGGGVARPPDQSNIEFLAARIRIALDVRKKS
jgi:PAS domain S-box-containing protein